MSPTQQAEEERHDSVSNLLSSRCVNVDESEPEVSSKCGVHSAVGGAETENELVRPEPALGGAWEVREGVNEHRGGGLDLAVREAAERYVLDAGDAGEGVLLQGTVIDAVEGDDRRERGRCRAVPVGHCSSGSEPVLLDQRRRVGSRVSVTVEMEVLFSRGCWWWLFVFLGGARVYGGKFGEFGGLKKWAFVYEYREVAVE